MKQYPSIQKELRTDVSVIVQPKYDGSNIRAEWNSKKGFYKFGTRHQLMDVNTKPFGQAIPIIKDKYENDLAMVFKEQRWRDVICFFEFYGPNSFAGNHRAEDEKTVTLFDVNPYKMGILEPVQFVKLFKHLDIPPVLHHGKVNLEFASKVKNSQLPGQGFEGVVCKGFDKNQILMFKIKSQAWLDKLKNFCGQDEALYNKLA